MQEPKYIPKTWVVFKRDDGESGGYGIIVGAAWYETDGWAYYVSIGQSDPIYITEAEVLRAVTPEI